MSAVDQPLRPELTDVWAPVAVYGTYKGHRIDGEYLPATRRLRMTTGPLAGRRFESPSDAARAVVAALGAPGPSPTNGWRFWRLTTTDERIDVLR